MTETEIQTERTNALAAYQAALQAQSYTLNMGGTSRSKTNQDVQKLLDIFEYWDNRLMRSQGTSKKVKFGTARI